MSDTASETASKLLLVHYEAEIAEKRAASFTVNVDRGCGQKELDDVMDKMRVAVERQKKFFSIEAAMKDIANLEAQISATGAEIEKNDRIYKAKMESDKGVVRRGEYHGMTKEQESMRMQQASSVENMRKQIIMIQHRLDELRADVGEPMQIAAE